MCMSVGTVHSSDSMSVVAVTASADKPGLMQKLKVGGLFGLWYALNVGYNIYNKKATNMIHAHWFVATAQLVVGIVWSLVMWGTGLRKTPNLTAEDISA